MNPTDYVVIAAILLSAIVGAARGLLREVAALLTWIIALFLGWRCGPLLEPSLGGLLADPQVRPWAARVIIVVLVLLLGALVGAALNHFVRLSLFSGIDRLFGFFFGLLRGCVLLGVFVILGQLLRLQGEHWWRHSTLMPYGESIANGLRTLVGAERVAALERMAAGGLAAAERAATVHLHLRTPTE